MAIYKYVMIEIKGYPENAAGTILGYYGFIYNL